MPRPIIMTEEMKQKARDDFDLMLSNLKMSDGKFSYNRSFNYDKSGATVLLTPLAYRKIVALVTEFTDEVGWHGTVSRINDTEFVVEDIFVYPQNVTGSTVNTDQEEYSKWLYEQPDEVFTKLKMQGHSHVNMGVSPSTVDENHRAKILEQLDSDMFYIFQIWNKSLSVHTLIYDMKSNILYENKDVEVKLIFDVGIDDFMVDAKSKVQKRIARITKKKLRKQEQIELEMEMMYNQLDHYDLAGGAWC